MKAVFFDALGTLFDSREPVGRVYAQIASEFGVDATEEQVTRAFRGAFASAGGLAFGPGHAPAELRRLERDWWHRLVERTFDGLGSFRNFDAFFGHLSEYFANPASYRVDPEARPLLVRLREEGAVLGVISNFDFRLYHVLEGLGLSGLLDSITISSEVGFAKPDPRVFVAALARHGLEPRDAMYVGDVAALDVVGANAAGLTAVLLAREPAAPSASKARRVESLADVLSCWRSFQFA